MSSTQPAGASGWPRLLPSLLTGDVDPRRVLTEVSEAVLVEQRATASMVEVRIDTVDPIGAARLPTGVGSEPATRLWRLRVTLPPSRRRLRSVDGAVLIRDLSEAGATWSADVVDADLDAGVLVVAAGPDLVPEPGMVRLLPFDFLAALRRLVESPAMAGARPPMARLLAACAGDLTPAAPLDAACLGVGRQGHGDDAWKWPWALVWGPPGTGKTHTLVQEVSRILRDPDERVLVVSTTNRAIDEVALRLGEQPGGVLRVGSLRVDRFRDHGLLSLLPRPEHRLDRVERAQAALDAAVTDEGRARARVRLSQARQGLPRLRDVIADQGPRCVLTTSHAAVAAAASQEMQPFLLHERAPFTTVVIDEAGLLSRAVVGAIGLLASRQLVLVGDPRQLSPICQAERSMAPTVKRWLAQSAMQNVDHRRPFTQALWFQHRMHPDIATLVSAYQYDGRLQDAHDVRGRPLPPAIQKIGLRWGRASWVALEQCAGMNLHSVAAERGPAGSWQRPAGIEVFSRLARRYPELGQVSGLFISPYRAQAQRAQERIDSLGWGATWSASTVHAQQGSEADVVVFDQVRPGGWAVPEWKRLVNVALSRARHQVFVIAAGPELDDRAGGAELVDNLARCSVDQNGVVRFEAAEGAQQTLLGRMATSVDAIDAPVSPLVAADGRSGRRVLPSSADPASLGSQIHFSRAARSAMTLRQGHVVTRGALDLGPRLVRGVAGSGKTVVLARWAALELLEHRELHATIVFGNTALQAHLQRLVDSAWQAITGAPASAALWDRVQFHHIGDLLRGMLRECGLPQPTERAKYDYEGLAASLREQSLPPRFDLLYLDEAQDLGHDTLALLVGLVRGRPEGQESGRVRRPVRVFYDNAQNVYRRSTPRWADFGLDMRGRSTVLREGFRATRPTMEFALDVADALEPLDRDPDLRELMAPHDGRPLLLRYPDGGWHARYCVVDGQLPDVELHDTPAQELGRLAERVREWIEQGVDRRDIRILAPRTQRCSEIAAALRLAGIDAVDARNTSFNNQDPRVVVTTPQSFKGHEAELVVVAGVEGFVSQREDRPLVEALYVALTRARTWMWVSGVRQPEGKLGARVIAAVEAADALRQRETGHLARLARA